MKNKWSRKKITLVCVLCAVALVSLGMLFFCLAEHFQWFRYRPSERAMRIWQNAGFSFGYLNTVTVIDKEIQFAHKPPFNVLEDVGKGIMAGQGVFIHPVPLNPNYPIKNIDFAHYRSINNEVVGYLEFENLPVVSYPVFYQEGTEYYLKHNRYREYDIYGELYVEGKIAGGHSRTNTIIYGHNMRNGTMFGSLRAYKDGAYFPGNEFFWYYTPTGKYRYQIFSVYETLYTSDTFTWFAAPGPEYTAYLQKMKSQQKYDTGVTPDPDDEIITLCTCTSTGGDYRLVLQARMVYKEE